MGKKKEFKDRLVETMLKNNVTEAELKNALKCNKKDIPKYLNGERIPKNLRLEIIATTLGVKSSWLLGIQK